MTPEELFHQNKNLVHYIYNKHFVSAQNAPYKEDLEQEGFIALWKACLNYNPRLNVAFSTYACSCIYNGILRYLTRYVYRHSKNLSLEGTAVTLSENGTPVYLQDILEGSDQIINKENSIFVNSIIDGFSERDQAIMRDLMDGRTQIEVAKTFHLSQASISRTLKKFRRIAKEKSTGELD